MSAIVAHELTQRFGSDVALDAVDLALDQGEHLAVLGDNGAGKTTLLRILATAARPTSGRLEIFGLDAARDRKALRGQIGFVAHSP
ncbi:MAG TPA: ATP-binding cassette domain-containing protein, partial [Thermoanaerobaculia bacterium]|nr:ATP-binding cassette domain-containing protein [Thermoanaerobaculia bacterium]